MITADLILTHGNIHTLNDEKPHAQALAIKGETILWAGTREECLELKGPKTRITDLEGRTVLPGFNDAHCHLLSLRGQQLLQLDCSPAKVRSIRDIKGIIREAVKTAAPKEWILAGSYDPMKLAEKRHPNRWDLDEVSGDHPVHLRSQTCHIGVVNSAGLAKAGISPDITDPPGGEFERNSAGELTGVCKEEAHFLFVTGMGADFSYIPSYTPEQNLEAVKRACAEYNRLGITSVGDALTGPPEIAAYLKAREEGLLTARVYMIILDVYLPRLQALGLSTGFGDDWIRIGGIKSFVDGAIAGHTAWLDEPYLDRPDYHGIATKTPEEIGPLVRDAHRAGLQMEIHANGDKAISMVLDAYEAAQKDFPRKDPRHRIAHCTVVNPGLLERIKKLGVVVLPFSTYVWEHGDKMAAYGKRIEYMFAHRSFLDYGIPVGGSSDHPCATQNPFAALEAMVTRTSREGDPIGLSQKITLEEALKIYTRGSAYATFEENRKGALTQGMLADFIVVSEDPFKSDPFNLNKIHVLQTYTGGKLVFDSLA